MQNTILGAVVVMKRIVRHIVKSVLLFFRWRNDRETGGQPVMTDDYVVVHADTDGGPGLPGEGRNAPGARRKNGLVGRLGKVCLALTLCLSIPILLLAVAIISGRSVVRGLVEALENEEEWEG
jgi:hypothetical protein